ncbi:MAG TPA: hypothetical protein VH231_05235 [Solirubrobacteraceae bacterium]|nr:hypothetical protein [Solirubrobacteraceae bacterium]
MRIRQPVIGAALAAAAVVGTPAAAPAAPAALDPGFGNGGIVLTAFPVRSEGDAMAIDGQGRIVVAGEAGSPNQIALARYPPDGTLDSSFGGGTGKAMQAVGVSGGGAGAVAIQRDGKIVVAGTDFPATGTEMFVARFNEDGTLDTGFNGGIVSLPNAAREASALLIQSDDKIVVGASGQSSGPAGMVLVRLMPGGTLDPAFDGDGVAHVWNDAAKCGASDQSGADGVMRLPDGDLLAGGTCGGNPMNDQKIGVARFHGGTTGPDGALDTSFGNNGAVADPAEPGTPAFGANLARQDDGKLIEGGASAFGNNGNQQKAVVMRRNADGSLDASYGSGGVRLFQIGALDSDVTHVQLDSENRVRAAAFQSTAGGFGVAGLTTDGALDDAFAPGGLVFVPFGEPAPLMQISSIPLAMTLQSDGKAVVVGQSRQNGDRELTLMRFLAPTNDTAAGTGTGTGGGTGTGATTPQPLPPGLAGATAGLNGVRISSLRYNGRAITFSLRCPATAPAACAGTLTLATKVVGRRAQLAARRKRRTVTVGATTFSVNAAAALKSKLTPTRAGKALLRAHKRLRVGVTLTNASAGQRTTAKATIVRVTKKRKRHSR